MKSNWVAGIFAAITYSSTRLRQVLWRWLYNRIALRDVTGKFLFMNYGYYDEKDSVLLLEKQDEPFRYYIQLYHHVVKAINLHDKDILEVGCGRGGGGAFLLHYKKPRSYTGIDLSEAAIAWCQKHYSFANAHWLQGRADSLPVPDASIDVVVNVESSHCYPAMDQFLSEVNRTLRPNGYFAYCDLRLAADLEGLDNAMKASGLHIILHHDITHEVLHSLDSVSQSRDKEIDLIFPAFFRGAARDFAGVKDTAVYNMLKSGEMNYVCYLLQKTR